VQFITCQGIQYTYLVTTTTSYTGGTYSVFTTTTSVTTVTLTVTQTVTKAP
jgi:hypothetical protein